MQLYTISAGRLFAHDERQAHQSLTLTTPHLTRDSSSTVVFFTPMSSHAERALCFPIRVPITDLLLPSLFAGFWSGLVSVLSELR